MRLVVFLLIIVYGVGGWKFWNGYRSTNFSSSLPNRLALTLFWPLLLASGRFWSEALYPNLDPKPIDYKLQL